MQKDTRNNFEAANCAVEQPAAKVAYQRLTAMLLAGKFSSGAPVREATLAQQLGFSRNAIREALNRLVGIDILEYIPYCGYRLLPYTTRDVQEWLQYRLGLEPVALELFFENSWCERERAFAEMGAILERERQCIEEGNVSGIARCDFSFHLKIVENCGNRRIIGNYLCCSLPFLANITQMGEDGLVSEESDLCVNNLMSVDEQLHTNKRHFQLLEEMHYGEPAQAVELLRSHLTYSIKSIRNFLVRKAMDEMPNGSQQNADTIGEIVAKLLDGC
ncbi:MAG: GntR family transcriptional regulator [Oligosphaeraceae bacterium]|nr:GntR family transcriptional regulator [Oligosphaeraceae bacterium]